MIPRLAFALALLATPVGGQEKPAGGALEGTVTLPDFTPRAKSQRYPGVRPPGEYLRGPAVVFIDAVPGVYEPSREKVVLGQKNRQFERLALPVLKGTTVSFPNNDDEYHNVFSRSKIRELELGRE